MTDFGGGLTTVRAKPPRRTLSAINLDQPWGQHLNAGQVSAGTGGVWPAANRALYEQVLVYEPTTIYQLGVEVTVQSGNLDLGVYDESWARLVSSGSTAVAAAGLQLVDPADLVLKPGVYFLAMACDNGTAAFFRGTYDNAAMPAVGIMQQASAFPLPANATPALPANAYQPVIHAVTWRATG